MAEPLVLAEVWANERTVSMSVSPTNAETINRPDRAVVRNTPRNTNQPRSLDQMLEEGDASFHGNENQAVSVLL